MLEVNGTLYIQIANFLLLIFLVNAFLFKPIRNMLLRRSGEISALEKGVEDFRSRAEQREKEMEESTVRARKDAFLERERLKGEGSEKEKGILQEAMSQAEQKVGLARKDMDSAMQAVRHALDAELNVFSKQLSEKILGRAL
jgi:F-type H+-transporting ATPase subunit b